MCGQVFFGRITCFEPHAYRICCGVYTGLETLTTQAVSVSLGFVHGVGHGSHRNRIELGGGCIALRLTCRWARQCEVALRLRRIGLRELQTYIEFNGVLLSCATGLALKERQHRCPIPFHVITAHLRLMLHAACSSRVYVWSRGLFPKPHEFIVCRQGFAGHHI